MGAKYLVTPKDGRVGKARGIAPFELEAGERHGDLSELNKQLSFVLGKIAKKRKSRTWTLPKPGLDTYVYLAETYDDGNNLVATSTIEALEA